MDFSSSTHPISWLKNIHQQGQLEIKPGFQRNPVWAARQKCYLIESILLKLPVPEIYIQQTTTAEGRTTYAVVDGQQRVRTVLQFIGIENEDGEPEYNGFALDKLERTAHWRDVAFADLEDEDKQEFYSYKFTVRYLNTDSEDVVRDMFRRLNKFLTPLNAQELRNAIYSGPFLRFSQNLAEDDYWVEHRIVSPAQIRRMNDIEFMSELVIGVIDGPQGGSSKVIDSYYELYEDYDTEFPEQRQANKLFGATLAIIRRVFPDIKELRWSNKTDFYTLFVAIASLLHDRAFPATGAKKLRKAPKRLFSRSPEAHQHPGS